uniref:Ribosomal protein S6 kinase like 1 n=1 Tax=Lates calcarifer TaxID=8187 RepID=A0A4W6EUN4_LATCA
LRHVTCLCLSICQLNQQYLFLCCAQAQLDLDGSKTKTAMAKRDYLVEAAKQIRMALDSEVNEDYEAAFSYYKNGVDLLLNGVQLDPNKDRREAVKRKTTQYLKRAEEIFITHLQDNLGKGSSHLGGYSSLRFRPIRHLSSPVEDLEMCKVVGVTDKVMIVQSMVNKETFVVKSLVKSSWESRDQPTIIPQGVPYMVKLLRYYVSEDAVYLHLEHVKGELSSPAILHLPLHCQTQIRGRASWDINGSNQGSVLCGNSADIVTDSKHDRSSPTTEERNGMVVIRSTDRAVFSDHIDTKITSESSWPSSTSLYHSTAGKQGTLSGVPLSLSGVKYKGETCSSESSAPAGKATQTCWGLPEAEVRVWGAQILLALESLHQQGILCRDLNPRNVLLTSNGKVCLTFFGQWSEVQSEISSKAMEQMYCAPEIGGVSRITEACDWWSLGALLFELLTGMPLWQLHPAGIHSHTQLLIPDHLSAAAASLLTELLQFDAGYRLGSGGGGVSDIKCHPFFSSISWKALSC